MPTGGPLKQSLQSFASFCIVLLGFLVGRIFFHVFHFLSKPSSVLWRAMLDSLTSLSFVLLFCSVLGCLGCAVLLPSFIPTLADSFSPPVQFLSLVCTLAYSFHSFLFFRLVQCRGLVLCKSLNACSAPPNVLILSFLSSFVVHAFASTFQFQCNFSWSGKVLCAMWI